MAKLSRAVLLGVVVQQARKFANTPKGQQVIAQARGIATDPAARAQLLSQARNAATDPAARRQLLQTVQGKGGPTGAAPRPGASASYPPATQPLTSPANAASVPPAPPGASPGQMPPA